MKKLLSFILIVSLFSCSKKDLKPEITSDLFVRVYAVEDKAYTTVDRIPTKNATKVEVEFEVEESENVKNFEIQFSNDASNWRTVKTIQSEGNKRYKVQISIK